MLWVERLARLTGFNRLSEYLLGDERYAPYLLIVTVVFIDGPVFKTINYIRWDRVTPWWHWPNLVWWLLPIVVISAVFFLRGLRKRHDIATRDIGRRNEGTSTINSEFSKRLQYSMLILGLSIYFIWFSTAAGQILKDHGTVIGSIRFLIFAPVVYFPPGTDLATAYANIQLVLPLRIRKADLPLDFSDPRHLGGMYSVGRAMRFAALSVFTALTVYTVWMWGSIEVWGGNSQISQSLIIFYFAIAWTSATGAFLIGLYIVHRHMRKKRQEELDRIHENVRELGNDGETFPYTEPRDNDEFQAHMQEYVNLNRVEQTSTFPFNVIVAWEMFAAALFPVVLQVISIIAPSSL